MAQPVKGFLSATGQFYENEESADFHDAALALQKSLLRHFHNDRQSSEELEAKCRIVREFINQHTDVVALYIRTKDLMDYVEKENDFVSVQPPLEVQEEDPSDPDFEGNGRDRPERSEPDGTDETMVDGRSASSVGDVAGETVGSTVQSEGDQEASDHVESDDETEGRVS